MTSALTFPQTEQHHTTSREETVRETYYVTWPKISSVEHFTILSESQGKLAWWGEKAEGDKSTSD